MEVHVHDVHDNPSLHVQQPYVAVVSSRVVFKKIFLYTVFVDTLTGRTITLEAESSRTVDDIKARIMNRDSTHRPVNVFKKPTQTNP
jgi:hypothetical protein